jgi:cytochrome c oxidase subunit 2
MNKLISGAFAVCAWAGAASAQPTPGGVGMQPAHSALAREVHFFHNAVLLPIIAVVCLFILALLLYVIVRFNAKANPTPRKFSHNTLLEVLWTGAPIFILLAIALPSFNLLYKEDITPDGKQLVVGGDGRTANFIFDNSFESANRRVIRPAHLQVLIDDGDKAQLLRHRRDYALDGLGEAEIAVSLKTPPRAGERVIIRGGRSALGRGDGLAIALAPTMTLKVSGHQWGWSYAYPEFGNFEFSSNMLPDDQVSDPHLRKLEVDNRIVVPVGETIRVTATALDVIHAWAVPAFAIKIDAVPGRINETWFNAEQEGVYYGQCSELCGIKHAFMPIAVQVVSRPEFETWINEQRAMAGLEPMFKTNKAALARAGALKPRN